MNPEFWISSWERQGTCTSFHRPDIHPYLHTYASPEYLRGKRVLVPLCGKTQDLLWFARYAEEVIGVELVEAPILQFFEENQLPFTRCGDDRYTWSNITLLRRSIFDVTRDDVGEIDFVYDRAALVALPLHMRLRYIDTIEELMPLGAQCLVITLEYSPVLPEPPFSITPRELFSYYESAFLINHVEDLARPEHRMLPKFGLSFLREHAFLLTKLVELQQSVLVLPSHRALVHAVGR